MKEARRRPAQGHSGVHRRPDRVERHHRQSAQLDLRRPWTQVMGGNLLKVLSWYDNEWGYSCRTVDLISIFGKM